MFCTCSLQNMLFTTAACNFWFIRWPPDSAPAALTGLLFDWPDTRIIEKTQHFVTSLTFSADVSSFTWLWHYCIFCRLTWLLYCCAMHLLFNSPYCRKFLFKLPSIIHMYIYIYLCLCIKKYHQKLTKPYQFYGSVMAYGVEWEAIMMRRLFSGVLFVGHTWMLWVWYHMDPDMFWINDVIHLWSRVGNLIVSMWRFGPSLGWRDFSQNERKVVCRDVFFDPPKLGKWSNLTHVFFKYV